METLIKYFNEISMEDLPTVGGKNASLGEMFQKMTVKGINVPNGFALTASAYWKFLDSNHLKFKLKSILKNLNTDDFSNLQSIGKQCRDLILQGNFSYSVQVAILSGVAAIKDIEGDDISFAVRSSATAEDLPNASFAGQQESYLNVKGEEELLDTCRNCYASLFTDRAIKYRVDQGFEHMSVALSVGVQQMVRSDKASSGVAFTIHPESGFKEVVVINSTWGLGEYIVKGKVDPDEFIIYKPSLKTAHHAILSKKIGLKQLALIYNEDKKNKSTTEEVDVAPNKQLQFSLTEAEIILLSNWSVVLEQHYGYALDIEWAKDGINGKLYIVQARPETVHSPDQSASIARYKLLEKGKLVTQGCGLGNKITSGKARVLSSPDQIDKIQKGDVLVTENTDPDWDPILKKVAAVITNKGGRTSHAAIVARELGAVAVVGATNATSLIADGQEITISCAEGNIGYIYEGKLKWKKEIIHLDHVPKITTPTMLIIGDPEKAFHLAALPNDGVGLLRMEFIISNSIEIHPMALANFLQLKSPEAKLKIESLTHNYADKSQYFIEKLSEAVGTIAAAFYPKEVIVRLSDFKSNEYANLIGGAQFEPDEENPMLGFRGASRYYSDHYKDGFQLECKAMKRVRDEMGFTNVKLMIPFCRTVEEGKKVLKIMQEFGLSRGENDLQVYVMIELPSNVISANQFAKIFDGFSIGSNDLTQLTLGLDRDNALINALFDENNDAVKAMIKQSIAAAHAHNIPVGICGQAPSDFPEYAKFLVEAGITSISFNPDALITVTSLDPFFDWQTTEYISDRILDAATEKRLMAEVKTFLVRYNSIEPVYQLGHGTILDAYLEMIEAIKPKYLVLGKKSKASYHSILPKNLLRLTEANLLLVPSEARCELKTILVPVDFSENSARALQTAVAINKSRSSKARIIALNVYESPEVNMYKISRSYKQYESIIRENITEAFDNFIKSSLPEDADQVEIDFVKKDMPGFGKYIVKYANKNNFDLIVMGTRGHSKVHYMFIGSTTEKVLSLNDSIPTLVVK